MRDVWIRGAAMTRFGNHASRTGRELVEEVVAEGLRDADLGPQQVQAAYVGNAVAGLMTGQESIRAQVALRRTRLMGVPMVNVENAGASGSTALHLAWQAVAYGIYDCVVAIGFEKLDHRDRPKIRQAINAGMDLSEFSEMFGAGAPRDQNGMMQIAGAVSRGDGSDLYDTEALALVAVKNHYHGSLNPCAHRREAVSVEQVLAAERAAGPLTRLMSVCMCDGAACAVLCSADCKGARSGGARVAASVLVSGRGDDLRMPWSLQAAARQAYELAGVGPDDLDVLELHDNTATAELYSYGHLGLCPPEDATRLILERTTCLGGRLPVNTSGGLMARGHALGATGIAQVVELAWQLEGRCGLRQVESARVALADNAGGWVGWDVGARAIHVLVR
jgi:acetyl-CoA acetyltransferase